MTNFLKQLLIFIFFSITGFAFWLKKSFGKVSVDQILFHIYHTEIIELSQFDVYFRNTFLVYSIILPLITLLILIFLAKKFSFIKKLLQSKIFLLVLGIASLITIFQLVSVITYLKSFWGGDYFAHHYISPQKVKIQTAQRKNLIYIYFESMESTYRDSNLMGRNLLAKIDTLKSKYPTIEFNDYNQIQGAQWTIAGMVASQCGVPLKQISAVTGNNEQGMLFNSYLGNAKCLNDILKENGYTNHFIQGTYIGIGGMYEFYKTHSTDKVYGDLEWSSVYPQFAPLFANMRSHTIGAWTSNDDQVFQYARLQVDELEAKKQPYNLMIATYDTHPKWGFLSPTCAKKGVQKNDFEKILECSQDEVVAYIDYLASKGYLKNTQVVIQGDHLTMKNPLYSQITKAKKRTVYNLLIGDFTGLTKQNDHINHFDMLPTTLDFIGLRVEGGRAGLGYSAFNAVSVKDAEKRNLDMQVDLLNYSETYNQLWTVNKNK